MSEYNCGILAVGSELLAGQIVNRNAATLSEKLRTFGLPTLFHLTLDDRESDIVSGLQFLEGRCKLIFVTGGLGPTSDDLTRLAVAAFVRQPLIYVEASWQKILGIFQSHGRVAPEFNKQQCYFPKHAEVLINRRGTADGFVVNKGMTQLYVLPGPPLEIASLWDDYIEARISILTPSGDRPRLFSWRTIGQGESSIAELIEPLVQPAGLPVAYRAHAPYVEIKLSLTPKLVEQHKELLRQVDQALAEWIFERNDESHLDSLVGKLIITETFSMYDGMTCGLLAELLGPKLRKKLDPTRTVSIVNSWEVTEDPYGFLTECLPLEEDVPVALMVAGSHSHGQWAVGLRVKDQQRIELLEAPYGTGSWSRNQLAIAFLTIKLWNNWMEEFQSVAVH